MYFKNLADYIKSNWIPWQNNIAMTYDHEEFTFLDLMNRSDDYRHFFREKDIVAGGVIAIINNKSFDSYAIMLACLQEGIAYVNIDPDSPIVRLKSILSTCQPTLIFSDKTYLESEMAELNNWSIQSIMNFDFEGRKTGGTLSARNFDGSTIAYIMFTSGSTGDPKGVAITHQNILPFIHWVKSRYAIIPSDNFANHSPMYFDNSVFDFYGALFNGASITPIGKELLQDPLALVNYVTDKKCTIWFSVPSLLIFLVNMKTLNANTLNSIRVFTFGGEGFPKKELRKLYDIYSGSALFINVYGPTEGTCICSSYTISERDFEDYNELPSLGTMNENFSHIIYNDEGQPDLEGELCIMGPNIGLGYYNNSELTESRFVACSNLAHYRKPMYKTGDLVKEIDGLLYFKGRVDNQIKHMGYRIELEEIEIALSKIEGVNQAAVLYIRSATAYGKIVAFIATNSLNDQSIIKESLGLIIPKYMIPSVIRFLPELPKNPNGKVDKNALKNSL
jgi:D-alanine--poly(phosphoribitol) ligase subunit 1